MLKNWIFTVLLALIVIFYSCMGLSPAGVFASLQDQETPAAAEIEKSEVALSTDKERSEGDDQDEEEAKESFGTKFKEFFTVFIPKRIQVSLNEKSDQILSAWLNQQSVYGLINVLQSAETGNLSVKPSESLTPYNKNHAAVSSLYLFLLTIIVFWKTILSFSVPVICLVIVPVILIYNIIGLWKNKDSRNTHRIAIAAVVTTIIITVAAPLVMKVSVIAHDYILAKNINEVIVSLEETGIEAGKIEAELRSGRRSNAAIQNYIASAKTYSNKAIKDSLSYMLFLTIIYILIPVFAGIGLYKLTKFSTKKILKK